jgi:hypothetical protein
MSCGTKNRKKPKNKIKKISPIQNGGNFKAGAEKFSHPGRIVSK